MAFSRSDEPFSVPNTLGDAWDEAMRQNRLLQAPNDPPAFGEAQGPATPVDAVSAALNSGDLAPADWQGLRSQQLADGEFGNLSPGAAPDGSGTISAEAGSAPAGPFQGLATGLGDAARHIVQLLHSETAPPAATTAAAPVAPNPAESGMAGAKRAAARDFGAHYIMDLIPQGEGTTSYDASYSNGDGTGKNYPAGWKKPTQLTIDEAIRMAPDLQRSARGDVIGKYQFKPGTLADLKTSMHLKGSELLTPALQDRMARQLLHRRGYDDYLAGYITPEELQRRLSSEWSSFAEGPSDLTHRFNRAVAPRKARVLTKDIQPAIGAAGGVGTPALTRALDEGRLPLDWR